MLHDLDVTKNIHDSSIPVNVIQSITRDLDVTCKWRDLVARAGADNPQFALRPEVVEECAWETHKLLGSPASLLLTKYSLAGMTVADLQKYLDQLGLEKALMLIKKPEPLYIVQHPDPNVSVDEDRSFTLICKASGFPYPRYVWFRGNAKLTESSQTGIFKVECASLEDAGKYLCRVHNEEVLRKKDDLQWSTPCVVSVRPAPIARACPVGGSPITSVPIHDTQPTMGFAGDSGLKIVQQPASVSVKMLDDVYLMCYTEGDPAVAYQWYRNNQPIPGQQGPQLRIPNVDMENAGTYQCILQGRWEKVRSQEAYVTVNPRTQIVKSMAPQIYEQPKDTSTQIDGRAFFQVLSHGLPLKYQWYHNSKQLESQCHPELAIIVDSVEVGGTYQCQVSNDYGTMMSRLAILNVDRKVQSYTARDKVALLIGNSTHRSQQQLFGVVHDIAEATTTFRKMGFKVVSLLDLNLPEMKVALKFFCSLLEEGVYCVFYFAGHGFAHLGQHYCIPWDVIHGSIRWEDCLCVEYVESEIQKTKPALFFMMLDICRKEECCNPYPNQDGERHIPRVHGNTVIWFAASYSQRAFEESRNSPHHVNKKGVPRGRFSRYVLKVLGRDKPLGELFSDFIDEFNKDEYSQELFPQNPEMRTNLKDQHRCLTDPILYAGHTTAMNKRSLLYETASQVPSERTVSISMYGVKLQLNFVAFMSNVMDINIRWVEAGQCENCTIKIHPTEELAALTIDNNLPDIIRIKDLQRLESKSLVAEFIVSLSLDPDKVPKGQAILEIPTMFKIDLGRPAISNLSMWTVPPGGNQRTYRKQAIQQEEETSLTMESDA